LSKELIRKPCDGSPNDDLIVLTQAFYVIERAHRFGSVTRNREIAPFARTNGAGYSSNTAIKVTVFNPVEHRHVPHV
jgi:hypothetical protein